MISIAKQTIEYFLQTWKKISIVDLKIEDKTLLNQKINSFVTIFSKWEVRWSAWNIKEIKDNLVEEIIENTFYAISKDSRFSPLQANEYSDLKIRIDKIIERNLLSNGRSIKTIDPTKFWVLVIKNDHSKMACILPNINPKLLLWEDYINILKEKLNESVFLEEKYYVYEIKTEVFTNY